MNDAHWKLAGDATGASPHRAPRLRDAPAASGSSIRGSPASSSLLQPDAALRPRIAREARRA